VSTVPADVRARVLGFQLRFTCPSGAVTGYGYKGADALGLNGHNLLGQHTTRPRV
jgi:hypothetical protein